MNALRKNHGPFMMGWEDMASNNKQIEEELQQIRKELEKIAKEGVEQAESISLAEALRYMAEERERTNRLLASITEKVRLLEKKIDELEGEAVEERGYEMAPDAEEIPLSPVDASIINFIQTKGMACADEVKEFMHYKGRNAACARLNKLHRLGLLERFQLGHKVFYKIDAGKATMSILLSPPQ